MTESGKVGALARRVGIAVGAFVIAWLAATVLAGRLFGSGNILVWVIAAAVGAAVYLELLRRDRHAGSSHLEAVEET